MKTIEEYVTHHGARCFAATQRDICYTELHYLEYELEDCWTLFGMGLLDGLGLFDGPMFYFED